jgi:saccharopine dehydrogenase (NAD+, L-lysine-forming)
MKDNILIVGGYGKVGSIISRHLAQLYPKKVIVAGRSFEKAKILSETLDHNVSPYFLDVNNQTNNTVLENTKLVVMCIDQKDTKFVELCIEKGVHYIDITANQHFIDQLELLDEKAKSNNVIVALSIGLAPGITNLLAQHCANQISETTMIDIFILLGIGEKHGDAAYRWTFDNIHSSYNIKDNGKTKTIKSFTLPKESNLAEKRKFYTFNFSDQHTLAKTINTKQVLTRMAFDSKILTSFVAFLRKSGLTKIFNYKKVQNICIYLFGKMNIGSDKFAVKAVAENTKNEICEYSLEGKGEGKTTAYIAIETVLYVMQNNFSYGVRHIHQIIKNIPEFLENLKQYDNTIEVKYKNIRNNE